MNKKKVSTPFHRTELGQKVIEEIIRIGKCAEAVKKHKGLDFTTECFKDEEHRKEFFELWNLLDRNLVKYIGGYFDAFGYEEGLDRMPEDLRKWWLGTIKRLEENNEGGVVVNG